MYAKTLNTALKVTLLQPGLIWVIFYSKPQNSAGSTRETGWVGPRAFIHYPQGLPPAVKRQCDKCSDFNPGMQGLFLAGFENFRSIHFFGIIPSQRSDFLKKHQTGAVVAFSFYQSRYVSSDFVDDFFDRKVSFFDR